MIFKMRNFLIFFMLIIRILDVKLRNDFLLVYLYEKGLMANFAASNSNINHMKKLFFILALSLMMLEASAEIRFRSIDNLNGTNIVLVDKNADQKVEITDAVLCNSGKEYPAKEIRCDVIDNVATYKLKFKRFTTFKDCKVILTVNGKKMTVDIQKEMTAPLKTSLPQL